jgi:hypothetical protein
MPAMKAHLTHPLLITLRQPSTDKIELVVTLTATRPSIR